MRRVSRVYGLGGLAATVLLLSTAGSASALSQAGRSADSLAFSKTVALTRTHLVAGADQVVDTRHVTVDVSQTAGLRDRQAITVSWKGAHPTGGIYGDVNAGAASLEEYPVVIMQCRGVDSSTAPTGQQVSPRTCWTQTPLERFQASYDFTFPPYRVDRYAAPADRTMTPGQPDPLPDACNSVAAASATHWVPFVAVDGHSYYGGGSQGCAGIAPEAVTVEGSFEPASTTYGVSDLSGAGEAKFVVQSADSNASLGCSDSVPCTLEIIPIMGISCDTTGAGLPPDDQPPDQATADAAFTRCGATGTFKPGEANASGTNSEQLAVAGQLWWSASNWRGRVSVPLTFAPSAGVCSVLNTSAPVYLYGSETMTQAMLQWAPKFCLNTKLFKFQHVQTGEPQAKNLLETGSVEAALQAAPPLTPFTRPVVQAPVAATGFSIVSIIDDAHGKEFVNLKLTPRLLAKLMAESYSSDPSVRSAFKEAAADPDVGAQYQGMADNPWNIANDPEFQALNPGLPTSGFAAEQAASLLALSSDSDVTWALTSYINADPDARAWLDGTPDPWGMEVNPHYKGIKLPVVNWPLLDTFEPKVLYTPAYNACLSASPVPWLPLVAAPVSTLANITLDMQFAIANSQINCRDPGSPAQKLTGLGRQIPGERFLFGVTSLADAQRYQLDSAQLLTHVDAGAARKFTGTSGRTFVGPTDASMKAALALLKPDATGRTWAMSYSGLRTSTAGKGAYPGTLLVSMDVATRGLSVVDAKKYSALIGFAVTSGQVRGTGNGQLPPGYLPLTAANGAAAFVRYSQTAAKAVTAQTGATPAVAGSTSGGTTTGGGTSSSGGSTSGSTAPSTPPSTAPSTTTTPAATPVVAGPVALVGTTTGASSGSAGLVLPIVLVLALAGVLGGSLSRALARRRAPG